MILSFFPFKWLPECFNHDLQFEVFRSNKSAYNTNNNFITLILQQSNNMPKTSSIVQQKHRTQMLTCHSLHTHPLTLKKAMDGINNKRRSLWNQSNQFASVDKQGLRIVQRLMRLHFYLKLTTQQLLLACKNCNVLMRLRQASP